MDFPPFGFIRQRFPAPLRLDPRALVRSELARTDLCERVRPGDRVFVTAGSRGISSMRGVLAALGEALRGRGAQPFVCPAMGSHGGGTGPGQVEVLRHLGITPDSVGMPIHEGMEPVEVGKTSGGVPVFAERAALEADHVVLVNRVKDHTDFVGPTESGLIKMAVVGLGRTAGADLMHRLAVNVGLHRSIQEVARVLFAKLPVLGGVAILEDHHNELRRIEAVPAGSIFTREPELLREAQGHKPKLPFERLDVLLCDFIGKDISGAGFDTKVIGRIMNVYEPEPETPAITRIALFDLTEASGGNAIGMGLADYTTRRLLSKADLRKTALNCIVSSGPESGRTPITLDTDREAAQAAFDTIGLFTPEAVRGLWISDTKHLEWLAATPALLAEAARRDDLEVIGGAFPLPFDASGSLPKLAGLSPRHP